MLSLQKQNNTKHSVIKKKRQKKKQQGQPKRTLNYQLSVLQE